MKDITVNRRLQFVHIQISVYIFETANFVHQ